MREQLVSFKTAKLAKEKGFSMFEESFKSASIDSRNYDVQRYSFYRVIKDSQTLELNIGTNSSCIGGLWESYNDKDFTIQRNYFAPTQSLLQKFIRETRGVNIEIHRKATGWYWSMCKADGGTDLGWSDYSGPNMGGTWDSFEDALENALQVQLSYDLPSNTKTILHWGNYVEFALKMVEQFKNK